MIDKEFIAHLSSAQADVRKLNAKVIDAKKINLKGKNILECIKESVPVIKHSQDTRETVTEHDLWGQYIETLEDGTVVIHDDEVTNPYAGLCSGFSGSYDDKGKITKVKDNKVYIGDTLYANVQTDKVKYGYELFTAHENMTTFDSDLSSLVNGRYMFYGCHKLNSPFTYSEPTSCGYLGQESYTGFNIDMPNLKDGYGMFSHCYLLKTFASDISALYSGSYMFTNCNKLTDYKGSDLNNLTEGWLMFDGCTSLKEFNVSLNKLLAGAGMFQNCTSMSLFSLDLPSLIYGLGMFYNCSSLASFTSDLSSLTDGSIMFWNCSKLTSFTSDLSSLDNGYNMFYGCKLDTESLLHIAHTIKDLASTQTIHIGIGNSTPTQEEIELLTEIHNKGWEVYVNGSSSSNKFTPTATTELDGDDEPGQAPIPYYAKPVACDESKARYVNANGEFFDILGGLFLFVNDPETYGMFMSEEDAVMNMGLTKYERPEELLIEKA